MPPPSVRLSPADHGPPQIVAPSWSTCDGLLQIHSLNQGGHWTLELEGELDLSNNATLDREIQLAETSAETITVDLRRLEFLESSGLHTLLRASRRGRLSGRF